MNTQKALSAIEEARTGRGVLNLPNQRYLTIIPRAQMGSE